MKLNVLVKVSSFFLFFSGGGWYNGQQFGWMVRDLEETCSKTGDKEIWGRGVWTDLCEWPKIIKIFVSQVNTHQIVMLAEEDFNNQVDRMTYTVDTSQRLSSASHTASITQWVHEQWPWWQGCRLHMGSTAWTFTHPLLSA